MAIEKNNENLMEWLTGEEIIACTFTQRKHVNLFRRLSEKFPEEYRIIHENKDGSIYGTIPINCLSFRSPNKLTEEQKADRAAQARRNFGRCKE